MPNQPERCCNKLVNARIQKKKLRILKKRLKSVTKSVDNTAPRSFGLPHLKRNLKKAMMLEDEYKKIEHQNRTLLQRMSNIMENPSRTTDSQNNVRKFCRSLNLRQRRENLDRITCDNSHLLSRLQKMEPYYKVANWEKDYKRSAKIMRHMMEFDYKSGPSPGAIPAVTKKSPSKKNGKRKSPKRGRFKRGSTGANSPQRLKRLSEADRRKVGTPMEDEVVELFRFPSLALRGVGVPDSAWDISLFDSKDNEEDNGTPSVLVLRGNKVTRTAIATLALDDEVLEKVVPIHSELQEAFAEMRAGKRAYEALGLLDGDTHLTTQLANLLLNKLRVTPDLKFALVFSEEDEQDIIDALDASSEQPTAEKKEKKEEQSAKEDEETEEADKHDETKVQNESNSASADGDKDNDNDVEAVEAKDEEGAAKPDETQDQAEDNASAPAEDQAEDNTSAPAEDQVEDNAPKPASAVGYYEQPGVGTPSAAWKYRGPVAEKAALASYASSN